MIRALHEVEQPASIVKGAVVGAMAAVPMLGAMQTLMTLLKQEALSVPPRQVAMGMARKVYLKSALEPTQRTAITFAAHLGYGAMLGGLYGSFAHRLRLRPAVAGAAFGLAVWAGSYGGWLPVARILRPPWRQPVRRNAVIVGSHLIWGALLGVMFAKRSLSHR